MTSLNQRAALAVFAAMAMALASGLVALGPWPPAGLGAHGAAAMLEPWLGLVAVALAATALRRLLRRGRLDSLHRVMAIASAALCGAGALTVVGATGSPWIAALRDTALAAAAMASTLACVPERMVAARPMRWALGACGATLAIGLIEAAPWDVVVDGQDLRVLLALQTLPLLALGAGLHEPTPRVGGHAPTLCAATCESARCAGMAHCRGAWLLAASACGLCAWLAPLSMRVDAPLASPAWWLVVWSGVTAWACRRQRDDAAGERPEAAAQGSVPSGSLWTRRRTS